MKSVRLIVAALSLLLCFSALAVGIRSYIVADGWSWSNGVRVDTAGYSIAWRKSIIIQAGRIYYIADRGMGAHNAFSSRLDASLASAGVQLFASDPPQIWFLGFEYKVRLGYAFIANVIRPPPVDITHVWVVPLWPIIVLTAISPAWWAIARWRASRRADATHCAHCGYDLRATPDRCPECGATPPARA